MLGINQFKENIVNEPIQLYGNNISNKDLMTALKEIGNALIENAKTTTSLLIKTYDNTTEIISYTKDLDIENLKKVTFDASNR
jgi:actin-like ATPase involved in cell morphogenesis